MAAKRKIPSIQGQSALKNWYRAQNLCPTPNLAPDLGRGTDNQRPLNRGEANSAASNQPAENRSDLDPTRSQTEPSPVNQNDLFTAVRYTLEELAQRYPGGSVEVRIPPAGAVQVKAGSHHRRGTPPAVIEMSSQTWLELACGLLSWEQASIASRIQASGEGASLEGMVPLFPELR